MGRVFAALLLVSSLAIPARSEAVDPAKVRAAIRLPSLAVSANINPGDPLTEDPNAKPGETRQDRLDRLIQRAAASDPDPTDLVNLAEMRQGDDATAQADDLYRRAIESLR